MSEHIVREKIMSEQYPTVLAVFGVQRDSDLYAFRLSCGHTNMFCHRWDDAFLTLRRKQSIGKQMQCYKRHDVDGLALPAALDPQQKADEWYF